MRRGNSVVGIFAMALFGLFAASVLMVLMLGAKSYQGLVTTTKESYEERICLQYIATKVSHYSGDGAVSVTQFGDGGALVLKETLDGWDYVTYLYLHDGQVKELFCEADVELGPDAGFAIMDVEGLTIGLSQENLLYLTCTGSGGTAELYLEIQDGEGELP